MQYLCVHVLRNSSTSEPLGWQIQLKFRWKLEGRIFAKVVNFYKREERCFRGLDSEIGVVHFINPKCLGSQSASVTEAAERILLNRQEQVRLN